MRLASSSPAILLAVDMIDVEWLRLPTCSLNSLSKDLRGKRSFGPTMQMDSRAKVGYLRYGLSVGHLPVGLTCWCAAEEEYGNLRYSFPNAERLFRTEYNLSMLSEGRRTC